MDWLAAGHGVLVRMEAVEGYVIATYRDLAVQRFTTSLLSPSGRRIAAVVEEGGGVYCEGPDLEGTVCDMTWPEARAWLKRLALPHVAPLAA
jgi:hypothetical protein